MDHLYFEKGRVLSGVEIASFRGKQICRRRRRLRRRRQHRRSYVLWCKSCLRSAVCMYFENREVQNGLKSFLRSTQPSKILVGNKDLVNIIQSF